MLINNYGKTSILLCVMEILLNFNHYSFGVTHVNKSIERERSINKNMSGKKYKLCSYCYHEELRLRIWLCI